ncbi:hypothetical protein [Kineobactrum salinum]|nr:hypothetical protein [Kineobactrum salinum]
MTAVQLCLDCDEPTGRCEEDEIHHNDEGPLCEGCYDIRDEQQ